MENNQMNNLSVDQMFQQYLSSDERIIWSGQPKSKLYMGFYDYLLALFEVGGLVFMAFFFMNSFKATSMPSAPGAFGLIFNIAFMIVPITMLIIGIYMLFFRPLKRHNKLKNTYYAVTNLRILEIQPNKRIFLESKIESLPGLSIRDESKPTGTLIFATQNDSSSIYMAIISGMGKQIIPTNRPVAFVNIPNAQSVCDIIKRASTQPLETKPISLMSSGDYQEEIDLSKEPVQSAQEEMSFPDSPTPRTVPLSTAIALLFGNALAQFGWVFFGFGMIFFWIFGMQIDVSQLQFSRGFNNAQGIVTKVDSTGMSSDHQNINKYSYTFTDSAGIKHSSESYGSDNYTRIGQPVSVEYLSSNANISRVSGMLRKPFGWFGLLVVLFPLIGLLIILGCIVSGIKRIGLLKNGKMAPAQLKSMSKIVSSNEGSQSVSYKMIFTYTASDGRIYETNTTVLNPEPLKDQKSEPLLYNPAKPSSAVLMDSIPGEPRFDSTGSIVNKKPISVIKMLCSLIIPLLALLGHGYYAYINYIK